MKSCVIQSVSSVDARFALPEGAGTDSVHTSAEYCMAVTRLASDGQISGTGIALTLGDGNRLVCEAIDLLAKPLAGLEINELMSNFGRFSRRLADDPCLRWLGPHKGVVHLALASITNACFDLWAKSRAVPLWRLLLDLTPEEIVAVDGERLIFALAFEGLGCAPDAEIPAQPTHRLIKAERRIAVPSCQTKRMEVLQFW